MGELSMTPGSSLWTPLSPVNLQVKLPCFRTLSSWLPSPQKKLVLTRIGLCSFAYAKELET